jgi:hypothetical protein
MKALAETSKIVSAVYNEKRLAVIFSVLFLLSLLPLFAIAFYSHPNNDDFTNGADTRAVYLETHNIIAVLTASCNRVVEIYHSYQGTFSSVFLYSLHPAVFNEALYPVTAFVMLFMLIGSTAFLLQTILVKVLGLHGKYVILIGVPILFFSIQGLTLALHAFFMWVGAVQYTLFYSITLFLLGTCIRIYSDGASPKTGLFWLKAILAAAMCFLVGGANYVTALSAVLLLAAMVVACFAFRKPPATKRTFVVLYLILLAGFTINVTAPGNAIRQTGQEEAGVIEAIAKSFYYAVYDMGDWMDLRVVSALFFLTPVFYKMARGANCSFKHPLLVAFFSFCLYAAQYAPTAYAWNAIAPPRIRNICYFTLVLLVFLNYFYIIGYIERAASEQQILLNKAFLTHCACVTSIFAVVFLLFSLSRLKEHTTYLAARDLYNGSATQYALEMNERYKILLDDDIQQAELSSLTNVPQVLAFLDINADKDSFWNRAMAAFYQKEYVVINYDLINSPRQ